MNRIGALGAAKGKLTCQCHGSTFEPRNAGKQLGGPAPRDLPALPVRAEAGQLVVAGSFTGPIGPA
ncbi:MAG: Rieske 2Fe-2S domain-containing protein [Rhodovibrio sp.]|nr:Rieske 2Fe-2S domain-containing protein [Rhodovibrio sp.]